jgi:PDZ and LIM domain protein 5/6/7
MHQEGQPYCNEDFQKLFGKTCGGCGKPIEGQFLRAMEKDWHPTNCFVCSNCKGTLSTGFFNKGGKPVCKNCTN